MYFYIPFEVFIGWDLGSVSFSGCIIKQTTCRYPRSLASAVKGFVDNHQSVNHIKPQKHPRPSSLLSCWILPPCVTLADPFPPSLLIFLYCPIALSSKVRHKRKKRGGGAPCRDTALDPPAAGMFALFRFLTVPPPELTAVFLFTVLPLNLFSKHTKKW